MVVGGVTVIAIGLVTAIAVPVIAGVQAWQTRESAVDMLRTTRRATPALAKVTALTIVTESNDPSIAVEYVVSDEPRYELVALPGAKVAIEADGDSATLHLTLPDDSRNNYVQTRLTVYGPALRSLTADNISVTYAGITQTDELVLVSGRNGSIALSEGVYSALRVTGASRVDMTGVTVSGLVVDGAYGLNVTGGTVNTLTATLPDACPANRDDATTVQLDNITKGSFMFNGQSHAATTYRTGCAAVVIGDDSNY